MGAMGIATSIMAGWWGVPINNPASVTAWASSALNGAMGGGIWSAGGVASDGTNPFVSTGNSYGTGGVWNGGEAVIRFQPGQSLAAIPAIIGCRQLVEPRPGGH
jgi:hypothetical protein